MEEEVEEVEVVAVVVEEEVVVEEVEVEEVEVEEEVEEIQIRTQTYVHTHTHTPIHTCTHTHTHIHPYTHTPIHAYTPAHIHTNIHSTLVTQMKVRILTVPIISKVITSNDIHEHDSEVTSRRNELSHHVFSLLPLSSPPPLLPSPSSTSSLPPSLLFLLPLPLLLLLPLSSVDDVDMYDTVSCLYLQYCSTLHICALYMYKITNY